MTQDQEFLIQHLTNTVEIRKKVMKLPKDFKYHGMDDYLLQHGRFYEIGPKPSNVPWGIPRNCYHNALALTRRKGVGYVEGYAVGDIPFPIHHGWNIKDGVCFDNTWRTPGIVYYGIEFDPKEARKVLRNSVPMLDNWKDDYPLFREAP